MALQKTAETKKVTAQSLGKPCASRAKTPAAIVPSTRVERDLPKNLQRWAYSLGYCFAWLLNHLDKCAAYSNSTAASEQKSYWP
jgi:hypothetical protein